ncbi:MAG: pyridoxal-phosphate dependent enzyme [Chloroflexi bacterium]|nr:pyridoxal-phosphate dependent enzyme [Chloroflexota bacterium]
MTVTYLDVLAAAERVRGVVNRTPVFTSRALNSHVGVEVFFKGEHLQRTGSFKFRGAYNALTLLDRAAKKRGVVAFSSGNHAQGLAYAAKLLGIPAVICMPSDAPKVKLEATAGYGAEIVRYDRFTQDREQVANEIASARGLTLIPPYDHPHIIAGQGTAALELCEEVPDLDVLFVPVGGGGLIAGSALAAHGTQPGIRVYGVEPHNAADTHASFRKGERVKIDPPDTLADGLRITIPGRITFPIVQQSVHDIITVTEPEIVMGTRYVIERLKQVIEPSAGTGPGAVLSGKIPDGVKRLGVILCGGNIEPQVLAAIMADG